MLKLTTALTAAAFLGATALASASSAWFHDTETETAYDKALAHDLATRAAVRKMQTDCSAQLASISEVSSTATQDPATGQWRVTVQMRGLCNNDTGSLP